MQGQKNFICRCKKPWNIGRPGMPLNMHSHRRSIKDRWNDLESYVTVLSKRVTLDEMDHDAEPVQIFKVGTSTLSGNIQRLISARTYLLSFKL